MPGVPSHEPRMKTAGNVILCDRHRHATARMDNDQVNQLLVRIGHEDQAAFRELYKAFSRKVYAYVLNMLNDHARAEEVVADTLYEIWRQPKGFRGDSQFSTWLIGIARRKALMAYRARRPDEVHGDLDDIAETTASDTPDGFAELAGKQRREGVHHCMGKLSDEHRECLHLVFYEGMGLAEVAQVQNCPEGTVKSRCSRGRAKLAKQLAFLRNPDPTDPVVDPEGGESRSA